MSTWFQLNRYGKLEITPVEVLKETTEFVVIIDPYYKKEKRIRKGGEFFPTFDEAKNEAIIRAQRHLQRIDDERSRAIETLKKSRELTVKPVS